MPPEALGPGNLEVEEEEEEEEEEEGAWTKPTKAWDIYAYGCIMMQVRCMFSFKCHVADIMQVFSGRQPYAGLTNTFSVMRAMQKGREPFSKLDGIGEEIQQLAQLSFSRDMERRPLVGKIVEFLWSQTNIAQTMKTMLSQLPVTVTQISQAVLMKCDYHPNGLDLLGAALKCKWVVHGSSEIEVGVFVKIYGTACNPLVDRSRSRL
jgi:hypothetical protein